MKDSGSKSTLERFFAGLTEQTFQTRLAVADPEVTDYLSGLLVRFIRYDAVFRVRSTSGKRLREVAEMLLEAEQRHGEARREVHVHIGDFTLFWTGLFPESLKKMQSPDRKDFFIDYCAQGKRAYRIAAEIESQPEPEPPATVLERLSDNFELCAFGLGEVRREWERAAVGGEEIEPPPLIN